MRRNLAPVGRDGPTHRFAGCDGRPDPERAAGETAPSSGFARLLEGACSLSVYGAEDVIVAFGAMDCCTMGLRNYGRQQVYV